VVGVSQFADFDTGEVRLELIPAGGEGR